MVPLAQQLECAERELALRRRNYPRWVREQKMTAGKSDHEIEAMEAIVQTLRKLKMLQEVGDEIIRRKG